MTLNLGHPEREWLILICDGGSIILHYLSCCFQGAHDLKGQYKVYMTSATLGMAEWRQQSGANFTGLSNGTQINVPFWTDG